MQYLFFIIGLAIIGLGVFAKVHSSRMYKLGITKAKVLGYQPTVKKIGETEIPCTQVMLEIPVEFGAVTKTVLDNGTYNVGDIVDIYYDPERDTVEFPKNISAKDSGGPYILVGFGALICLLIVFAEFLSGVSGEDGGDASDIGRSGYELELNEDGYSVGFVNMPEDERYYEYYYMPASEDENYAYNVKIYDYGIGVVTIFPMESNGKGLNQSFAFYMEYEDLKPIIQMGKKYDFKDLAGTTQNSETAQGIEDYEYLYYYNGRDREGSGGYGVESEDFDCVAEQMKAAVSKTVWSAVKEEIRKYYD